MPVKRSADSLTLADLPGADPARFDEWKRLLRRARVATLASPLVYASAFITVPVIGGGIGWLLPIVFWFAYMFAYAVPLARAERTLAAALGVPAALGLPATGGASRARRVIKIILIVWLVGFVLGLIALAVQLASSKGEPTQGSAPAAVVAEPTGAAAESFVARMPNVAETFQGARVPPQFFAVAGLTPYAGRFFLPADHESTAAPAVVVSYEVWQVLYDGDLGLLGRVIQIDGRAATVVGIAPIAFTAPGRTDFWMPAAVAK